MPAESEKSRERVVEFAPSAAMKRVPVALVPSWNVAVMVEGDETVSIVERDLPY